MQRSHFVFPVPTCWEALRLKWSTIIHSSFGMAMGFSAWAGSSLITWTGSSLMSTGIRVWGRAAWAGGRQTKRQLAKILLNSAKIPQKAYTWELRLLNKNRQALASSFNALACLEGNLVFNSQVSEWILLTCPGLVPSCDTVYGWETQSNLANNCLLRIENNPSLWQDARLRYLQVFPLQSSN